MNSTKFLILLLLLVLFTSCLNAGKYYNKQKEQVLNYATNNETIIYLIHKDICKVNIYAAIDDSMFSILPNKTYSMFKVEPGWHLLSVSNDELKIFDSFEIYCYPGETQVLNVLSLYTGKMDHTFRDKLPRECYCHATFFDRYPEKDLERVIKKNKLKFVNTTEKGVEKILKLYDGCVKHRNNAAVKKMPDLKLNFKDAVAAYQFPDNPPVWKDSWEFDLKVAPAEKSLFKLGIAKKSHVIVSLDGIEIRNEKDPDLNLTIPFENITGFDRILVGGKISPPFYLAVNYEDDGSQKQLRFFTGESNPYTDYEKCRIFKEKVSLGYRVNLKTNERIDSIDVHDTITTGYKKLVNITDLIFWFERVK